MCVLGTATGLAGAWQGPGLACLTSTGFAELVELAAVVDEEAVEEPDAGGPEPRGRGCSGLGRLAAPLLVLDGGWTAVPWACVSEGSGGAATRRPCTGMGFLLSRLTDRSCCECVWDDEGDWPADLDVLEGLLPIFHSIGFGCGNSYTSRPTGSGQVE